MRIFLLGLAAAAIAGCTAPPPSSSVPTVMPELAGRVAGAAKRCITFSQGEGLRIAGPSTLTYRAGRTIYVNEVPECTTLRSSDILILEPVGSQYCRGDFVRTRDNQSGIPGPGCRLNDFVPYTRP